VNARQPARAVRAGYVLINLLLIAAIGFAAFLVIDGGVGVARGGERPFSSSGLDVHVQVPPEHLQLPPGLRQDGGPSAVARIEHPGSREILLWTALQLTQAALFISVLWLLRGLAHSVRRGDPFDAANVQRLRGIGFMLAAGGVLVEIVNMSLRQELWQSLPAARFEDIGTEGFSLPGNLLLAGLGAFILAEVFAQGLRMREDLEGTV
jgi:hypothetical protein